MTRLSRELFADLIDAESLTPGLKFSGFLRRHLDESRHLSGHEESSQPTATEILDHQLQTTQERLVPCRQLFRHLLDEKGIAGGDRDAVLAKALLELTPISTTLGAWLQWMSGPGNAEDASAMATLRVYAGDIGAGQPHAGRADHYRTLMGRNNVLDAGTTLRRTAAEGRISDGAFYLPTTLLLMSRMPQSMAGEILGADLYMRHVGLLPAYELLAEPFQEIRDRLDCSRHVISGEFTQLEASTEAAAAYLSAATDSTAEQAFVRGYFWCRYAVEEFHDHLATVLQHWLDPRQAVAQLLVLRAREASVYHTSTGVGQENLQEWFRSPVDPLGFLNTLANSPYIRPGEPERSPLINGLISPRGKMFRIFTTDDVQILHRWISSLPNLSPLLPEHPLAHTLWADRPLPDPRTVASTNQKPFTPADIRQAYPVLLHREISQDVRLFAKAYIKGWLARAERTVAAGLSPLPAVWEQGVLAGWLHTQHERQDAIFHDSSDSTVSEEKLKLDSLKLAPLTLIDGAWLMGYTDISLATTTTGYNLFETYWDELGNGHIGQNHPSIYRALINEMFGALPPTSSNEFIQLPLLSETDFELPVFWLAIGRYPKDYEAEILGMNLAMELSGVGGGYRTTHGALKKHGYSTLFVDLHNTIDNISTGHSAWAAESIESYMAEIPPGSASETWHRVRIGFASLRPPSDRYARLIERRTRRKALNA